MIKALLKSCNSYIEAATARSWLYQSKRGDHINKALYCMYNTYLHFPLKGSRIAYCVCFQNKINKENMQMYFSAIEELLQ